MSRFCCLFLARAGFVAGLLLIPGLVVFGTTPVPINSYAAEDSGHDQIYLNPTAADGRGNWVTVWQDTTNTRVLASTSVDNATSWSAPVVVSDSNTTESYIAYPELATDRAGTWMAVWADRKGAETATGADADIFYSRSLDNGATWSPPAPLNSTAAGDAGSDSLPTLACDSHGNWLVVWHSDNPPSGSVGAEWDIWSARSTDGGLTWSAASPVNPNAAGDLAGNFRPVAAAAGTDTWLVAWNAWDGASSQPIIALSRSTDGGLTWSSPVSLSAGLNALDISLAASQDGKAMAGFTVNPLSFERHIYTVRSQDEGQTWTAPERIIAAGNDSTSPRFAPVAQGVWAAAWATAVEYPYASDWNATSVFLSLDFGSSWQSAFGAAGHSAVVDYGGNQYGASMTPALASDGRGRLACVFTYAFGAPMYTVPLIYGNDFDLFYTTFDLVLRSQSSTASYLNLLNRNGDFDTGDDLSPAIAADAQGQRVAVWQSNDSLSGTAGSDTDILVSRSTDSNQTWTSPTLLQPSGANDSSPDIDPTIATDSQGKWVTLWTTSGTLTAGRYKVVCARSADAGQTWSLPEVVNTTSTATLFESNAHVATDRSGSWVATWEEAPGFYAAVSGITMSRSQDGGKSWSPARQLGTGQLPRAATDGAGTWIVAYQREVCYRSYCGLPGLYLARSTNHGDTWTTGISPVPDAAGRTPDVAGSGSTWILVWEHASLASEPESGQHGIRSSISSDGGQTWSEPRVVSLDAAVTPRIIPEGSGRWLCVWSSTPWSGLLPSERDILYARSTDNGQSWSEPVRIDRGPSFNDSPAIALDGQGRPLIAWSGKNSPDAGADYDIWFATAASTSFTGAADWQLFE